MLLKSQRLDENRFNRHLVARAFRAKSRKKMVIAGLMLTSMVDMFSLLVIFLLQSFSTSPELVVVAKNVQLPAAHSGREIKDAPVLAISEAGVYLDQKFVGVTADLLLDPAPLMDKLEQLRTLWQKTHPNQKFSGEINLQADRDIAASTVSRFMGMLPSQAYGSIQLAVVAGSAGG